MAKYRQTGILRNMTEFGEIPRPHEEFHGEFSHFQDSFREAMELETTNDTEVLRYVERLAEEVTPMILYALKTLPGPGDRAERDLTSLLENEAPQPLYPHEVRSAFAVTYTDTEIQRYGKLILPIDNQVLRVSFGATLADGEAAVVGRENFLNLRIDQYRFPKDSESLDERLIARKLVDYLRDPLEEVNGVYVHDPDPNKPPRTLPEAPQRSQTIINVAFLLLVTGLQSAMERHG